MIDALKFRGTAILLVALAFSAGVLSTHADTVVWSGSSSGNWSVGANWMPNHAPSSTDTAVITNTGNYTVTLDEGAAVAGLVLGTTSVGSTQTLVFNGQTLTLNGQATINAGGQFNLSNGTFYGSTGSAGDNGAVFNGTLLCSGGALGGNLTMASNSVLTLAGTAALNSLILLTNYGTVTWISGDLAGYGGTVIDNYGLWNAQTNGNLSGVMFNNFGTFLKSGGTDYGNTFLDGTTTFNNLGTLDVEVGILFVTAGTGSGIFNNATNAITGFNPNTSYTLAGNPTFTGAGLVRGPFFANDAVIHGTLNFNSGTSSGVLTLASNSVLNLLVNSATTFSNLVFTNYGTVTWISGDVAGHGGTVIDNYGLWNAQTNGNLSGVMFNNFGTFLKSGGTDYGNTFLDSTTTFNNLGTLDVEVGVLFVTAGTGSGIFNNATNAITGFNPNTSYTLAGNPTFTGAGSVGGPFSASNAVIHGTLNFIRGPSSGVLTLASNSVLNLLVNSATTFSNLVFTNYGTVNWSYGGSSLNGIGTVIDNYGLWNAQTNGNLSGVMFNNFGTFLKSGGTYGYTFLDGTTTFNNLGTLDVQTGAVFLGGNYVLTGGTLNFGISSPNDFGSLFLSNNAALAGKLSVNLNNNYSPGPGGSYALLTYGSATGAFSTLNLPQLSSGLIWQTNYGTTNFTISVGAILSVQLVGKGVISPNYSNALLQVGTNYSMTAAVVAGSGFAFSNWTGGTSLPLAFLTNGLTLKFVMASNLMLQANFVDTNRPTLTIAAPIAGQRWSNMVFTVNGIANDNNQVSNVFYLLNNGIWTNANSANNWSNWSAQVALLPGTNHLSAYASDYADNNSITSSVNMDFVVTNQLEVSATGLGTTSPNYSNAWLEVGRNYTIKATPASGFVATNWVTSINWLGGVTTNNATVQFMMQSNLTLQVNFADVTKPTLTITAPTAGQHMTNALADVRGTAKDNWRVSSVWYQLNSGTWSAANTTNVWTNWGVTLPLALGTNIVKAYAVDLGGNSSATNSVSVVSSNAFKLQLAFTEALPLQTNGLVFSLQLSTGLNGHIQFSTNLASWTMLTNFVGTNSTLFFRDPAATNSTSRFYRAVVP